mmetsp:Transcript_26823/g.38862  ORF Transcript_26823/g.38862 Transcript_26823/m.38862 type:complete len:686 (-) Transcript_26823:257-2314(-)
MADSGAPQETTALLGGDKNQTDDGVRGDKIRPNVSSSVTARASYRNSWHALRDLDDDVANEPNKERPGMPAKSYSVNADGTASYLSPLEMGRHELYEMVPFAAVFGMQKKERSLSQAFASFAGDLDAMEADQLEFKKSRTHLSDAELEKRRSHASLLLLDELEFDAVMVTSPLIIAVAMASMLQFLLGYNIGVMNAPASVVFPGHSTGSWAIAVAAFAVGGPFGAMMAGKLADSRGRRGALLIDTWIFLLGGLLQTLAIDMYSIIIARFIIGFGSGFASVLVPIYLGELAPPNLRGMFGTLTQFAMVIGILVSDFFAFPFATEEKWRYLFSITPITAALLLLFSPFLLESPRWLLGRDRSSRKARYIIKILRGLRYDHEVETEVSHFVSASQNQHCDGSCENDTVNSGVAFTEMLMTPKVRTLLISCLILQMGQQLCGINAVFYYSTSFFEGIIDNPLLGTTIVGAVNVVATYVALLLMDSCGRRTLILWSSGGMFMCCVVIVLSLLGYFQNIVALLAVNVYVSFFEIGLGPIPWLIVAEMFDAKYVTTAMAACSQLNWVCNFVVGFVFPYLNEYLGPYSFVPFAMVLALTFIFAALKLPETQGTTPEELMDQLVRKNSSVVYHNMNIEDAHNNPIDLEWKLAMEQLKQEDEAAMESGSYNYGFKPIEGVQPPASGSDWQSGMGH